MFRNSIHLFAFVYHTQLCTNFVLVFKQVRILPEIDGYHYQSGSKAPLAMVIVWHWIKTHKQAEAEVVPSSSSVRFKFLKFS